NEAEEDELAWVQSRLQQVRRATVKLVRRIRAAGRDIEGQIEAREAECEQKLEQELAAVREHMVTALTAIRHEHAVLAERMAELPSAAAANEAQRGLASDLGDLKDVVARLDEEHRRHAADVED